MRTTIGAWIATLYLTVKAQSVGVGTTTPQAQLHIQIHNSYSLPALMVDVKGNSIPHLVVTPDGKVGIQVLNPQQPLDVNGNIQFSGALMPAGNAGTAGQVLISQGPGSPPLWVDAPSIGDNWGSQVAATQSPIVGDGTTLNPIALQNGTTTGDILVWNGSQWVIQQPGASSGVAPLCNSPSINYLQKWTGTEICNSIIYDDGVNVGIGTSSPIAKFDVQGSVRISSVSASSANGALVVSDNAGILNKLDFSGNPLDVLSGDGVWRAAPWDSVCNIVATNYVMKWTGTSLCNSQIYDDGTNVGIGTTTPTQKLDVSGNIQFSGALMPGGNPGSAGQVLVSQGPGNPPQWKYLSSPGLGSCVNNITPCLDTLGNPTSCGYLSPSTMDLQHCVKACSLSTYGGFTDWRVPSIEEFFCLFTIGYSFPGHNNRVFYWTSSPVELPSIGGSPSSCIRNQDATDALCPFYSGWFAIASPKINIVGFGGYSGPVWDVQGDKSLQHIIQLRFEDSFFYSINCRCVR